MHRHIRKIFSVFALGMMVLFGLRLSVDAWSFVNWGMLLVSALVCLLVFRCFVFIFNYSYALACLLNGLFIAIAIGSTAGYLLGGVMAAYGARLFWFTWSRTRSDSYAARVENVRREDARLPVPVKFALWLQCTFLYTFHLWAVYAVAVRGELSLMVFTGAGIIVLGLVIEALADAQKQAAKAGNPADFVRQGLYANWRHPNYIGEILVQAGLIVAGLAAVFATWGNVAAVIISPLYVILLMISECGRADDSMQERYGEREDFLDYRNRSGRYLPKF